MKLGKLSFTAGSRTFAAALCACAALCLSLSADSFASLGKRGGIFTITDDLIGAPAANVALTGGSYFGQGFIGSAVTGARSGGLSMLESGFYSYMLTQSVFNGPGVSTGSLAFNWSNADPAGAEYTVFLSTYAGADAYLAVQSTRAYAAGFFGLGPNTTYYAYMRSDYMESDFTGTISTAAVTLSSGVIDNTMAFNDVGPRSANLLYHNFLNPGAVFNTSWTKEAQASLPKTLYGHGTAIAGNFIFAAGGNDGVSFSSAVYRSALNGSGWGAWENAGYLPSARYGAALLAAKGRLYLLAGYNSGGATNQVWSTAISTAGALGTWRAEAPLNGARYMHAAVLYKGQIYVSGGYSAGADAVAQRAALADDGSISAWNIEQPLPSPRYGQAMSAYNGTLYVTGGRDGASARSTVWAAGIGPDGGLGPWLEQRPLPSARYGHKTEIVDGRLIIAGGNNGSAAQLLVFGSTISADGTTGVWQGFNSLPSPRQFHTLEKIGGKLCLLGGSDGAAPSADVAVSTFAGTEYLSEAALAPDFSALAGSSAWNPDHGWNLAGLTPDTGYYFRVKARNWAGAETPYSAQIATRTYAAVPALSTWTIVNRTSATVSWAIGVNPPSVNYYCEISSSPNYIPLAGSLTVGVNYALFQPLTHGTTFYTRVRAVDSIGRNTAFLELPPFKTYYDPALDTSSPTIVNAQTGDPVWRSTNTYAYAVEFHDTGGSGLDKFQVQAATAPGGADGIVAPWTDAVTGIAQDDHTAPWPLPAAAWANMAEGLNYISVRAFDNVGNSTKAVDVFYVMKDTTPPAISLSYVPPAGWLMDYPGPVSSATFKDARSGLKLIQYSVSAARFSTDGKVIPWTEIAPADGYSVVEATWSYDFARLTNGASNYFSLRSVDQAGNEGLLVDAFVIQKNVKGPIVTISSPAAPYLSTITLVSGYNTETNGKTVMATELSVKDKTSGLYWDGGGFVSAARLWRVAAGTYPFVLDLPARLTGGRQYEVAARSSDTAGNYSVSYATYTFTFDDTPPALTLLHPAGSADVNSENYFSGTAGDSVSGVLRVEAALKRLSDGKWWDPGVSNWAGTRAAAAVGGAGAWTYDFPDILAASLTSGASYYWTARAFDKSAPANVAEFDLYGDTFTYFDVKPPAATDDLAAAPGENPGTANLRWTARGDDGAAGYLLKGDFAIQYSTFAGVVFSTGSAAVTISTAALTAGTTAAANLTGLSPGTSYYFALWTRDDAGNWSGLSNIAVAAAAGTAVGKISGMVTQASSQPIQGVIVEAYNPAGGLDVSDATSNSGKYSLHSSGPGKYTVKVTWSADDITSSVSKGGVDYCAADINFTLSIYYQLASVSGVIPSKYRPAGGYRASASDQQDGGPYAELFQRGRRVAMAYTDELGNFSLDNLLPGTYSIRVYNGKEFTDLQTIRLKEGQRFIFAPKWAVLNKDEAYAYPNPASGEISFHFETDLTVFEAEISVFDIAGRLVKKFPAAEAASDTQVGAGYRFRWLFSREKVASGVYIYMLNIKDPATGERARIIKKFAIIR